MIITWNGELSWSSKRKTVSMTWSRALWATVMIGCRTSAPRGKCCQFKKTQLFNIPIMTSYIQIFIYEGSIHYLCSSRNSRKSNHKWSLQKVDTIGRRRRRSVQRTMHNMVCWHSFGRHKARDCTKKFVHNNTRNTIGNGRKFFCFSCWKCYKENDKKKLNKWPMIIYTSILRDYSSRLMVFNNLS